MTTMQTAETNIMAAGPLAKIIESGAISAGLGKELLQTFAPLAQKADKLARDAAAITVTDATQVSAMREARKQRLALREVRCDAENRRKEHKADFLKAGKIIDNMAAHVASLCESEEARLEECEKFAERAEAAARAKLAEERTALLLPLGVDVRAYDLGGMKAEAFDQLLEGAKLAKEKREREAEEARVAEEKRKAEEAAERERMRVENERLRAEKQAAEAAAAEARRKAEAERAEAERVAKAERDALEAKAAKERKAAADKLAAANAEAARLKAEAAAREKAEAAARAEADRKARAAAAAPDAEKLRMFAGHLSLTIPPDAATDEGKIAMRRASNMLRDLCRAINEMADGLAGGGQ
jgi:hypothetical protein